MTKPYQDTLSLIVGEILADGIGVRFKIESQVQESVLKNYVNMIQP